MTYVNAGSVIAIGVLFPLLGIAAVGLRFCYRTRQPVGLGLDDWLCVPALICLWAEAGLIIAGARTCTIGWHSPSYASTSDFLNDDSPSIVLLNKLELAFNHIHPTAMGLLKLSICFFYRRVFRGPKFNTVSRIAIVIVILWIVVFTVTYAAACGTYWDARWASMLINTQRCEIHTFNLLLAYAISDVVLDLAILVIPVPLVYRLQMSLRRRVEVCAVLLTGALATACGIVRMAYNIELLGSRLTLTGTVAGLAKTDTTGIASTLIFWAMLENGVAMVAVCLPTLRAILATRSIETAVRSVRSILSLHSISSGRSKTGHGSTECQSDRKAVVKQGSEEAFTGIPMQSLGAVHAGTGITHIHVAGNAWWPPGEHENEGILVERMFEIDNEKS